jgi:hypothetical protein
VLLQRFIYPAIAPAGEILPDDRLIGWYTSTISMLSHWVKPATIIYTLYGTYASSEDL